MKAKVKTIDIQAKEWFDKINGNSYFAGSVTINFGLPSVQIFSMPFQYGYGDQFKYAGLKILRDKNIIDFEHTSDPKAEKLVIRCTKQENCKKRELDINYVSVCS